MIVCQFMSLWLYITWLGRDHRLGAWGSLSFSLTQRDLQKHWMGFCQPHFMGNAHSIQHFYVLYTYIMIYIYILDLRPMLKSIKLKQLLSWISLWVPTTWLLERSRPLSFPGHKIALSHSRTTSGPNSNCSMATSGLGLSQAEKALKGDSV